MERYLARAAQMRCPMRLHFGDRDRVVPMAAVEQVRAAFVHRDDVELIVHAGADHGYSHSAGPTRDPEAAAAGMASVRRLLSEVGGKTAGS